MSKQDINKLYKTINSIAHKPTTQKIPSQETLEKDLGELIGGSGGGNGNWESGRVIADLTSIPIDKSYTSVYTVSSNVELDFDLTSSPDSNIYIELYLNITSSAIVTVNGLYLNADVDFITNSTIKIGISWNGVASSLFTESNKDALESFNKVFIKTTLMPSNGLVGLFEFENDLIDSSVAGNDLTNPVDITYDTVTPRFGVASVSFNGATSLVEMSDLIDSDSHTVCGWININSSTPPYTVIIDKVTGGSYQIDTAGTGGSAGLKIRVQVNGTFMTTSASVVLFDTYQFYCIVYDNNTTTVSLYIDNVLVVSGSGSVYATPPMLVFGNDTTYKLDNLRHYNRALTIQEIDTLYNE
mgnify:CR=1 FL=1